MTAGASGLDVIVETKELATGKGKEETVQCPASNPVAVGGGYDDTEGSFHVVISAPVKANGELAKKGEVATGWHFFSNDEEEKIIVYAMCSK